MTAPDGFYRARQGVTLVVIQPLPRRSWRAWEATLLGGMFDRGKLLHYRVKDADGVVWFIPQGWTDPVSDLKAWEAGVPLPDLRPGAWVDRINAVRDCMGMDRLPPGSRRTLANATRLVDAGA